MHAPIMRKVTVSSAYQALSAVRLVGRFDVSTPPGNSGVVYFQGDDGSDVPWVPGEWHELRSVDLAAIKVKGTAPDCVTVVGETT